MVYLQQDNEENLPNLGSPAPPTEAPQAQQQAPISTGMTNQPKGSGRFQNLQKYIAANQGAGQQIGSQISGQTGKQAAQVGQQLGSQANQIRNVVDQEKNRLAKATDFTGQIQRGTAEDLGKINQEEFQKLRTGVNQGQQLGEQAQGAFQQAQTGIQGLQNTAQQAGTEEGRFGLLRQAFGTPGYSLGQRRLDQLLLQSSGTAPQLQKQIQGQAATQQATLQGLQPNIQNLISGYQTQAGTTAADLQKALGGAEESIVGKEGTLAARAKEQTGIAQANRQLLERALSGKGGMSDEDMAKAQALISQSGLSPTEATYGVFRGAPASTFLNPAEDASISQVATPEERARYEALRTLSGEQATPSALSEASAYNPQNVVNTGQLRSAIQEKRGALENQIANDPVAGQELARRQAIEQIQKDPLAVRRSGDLWGVSHNDDKGNLLTAEQYKQRVLARAQDMLNQSTSRRQQLEEQGGQNQTLQDLLRSYTATPENMEPGKGYII